MLGRIGVGCRLSSGEGFGSHEEQRSLGIRIAQRLGHMGAIDVGDKVEVQAPVTVWLQCFCHHDWSPALPSACSVLVVPVDQSYRSEPPIPMLMIVLIFFPVYPFHSPLLTSSEKTFICSSTELTSSTTLFPSTFISWLVTFRRAT